MNVETIDRFPKYLFFADGRVVSNVFSISRTLRPIKMGSYVGLQLLNNAGQTEKVYLHRLICEAFHGRPKAGQVCRHLDGDKTNNSANNLSWGSPLENSLDQRRHGKALVGEKNPRAKLNYETVERMRQMRASCDLSYAKISRAFNVSTMTAFRAITGRAWSDK